MRTIITPVILVLMLLIISSCAPTPITINCYQDNQFNFNQRYSIAVMPVSNQWLLPDEVEDINEDIFDRIAESGYATYLTDPSGTIELFGQNELLNMWDQFWLNYIATGSYGKKVLREIRRKTKIDLIVQGKVTTVERTRAVYRQSPGSTTAVLKISIFSTELAKLVWEANCKVTVWNAHSLQMQPLPIEAIDIAFDEIMDMFPYRLYEVQSSHIYR